MAYYKGKRSFYLAGEKTSVLMERIFWELLNEIAAERKVSVASIVLNVDRTKPPDYTLGSALREYIVRDRLKRDK